MMTDIRGAFTRKFGPLPAWAWLTALAGAVYLWRRRAGSGTVGGASNDTGIPADDTSAPESRDPITLQPGETAYDPNTGQTVSGAPNTPEPGAPIVLGPGEVAYDPGTGKVIAGQPSTPDETGGTDAPESPQTSKGGKAAAATQTGTPSALTRAKNAVRSGKVGPRNRARLEKAGFSKSQIAFHTRRKTALGLPATRKPKPKPQHEPAKKTVKHPTTQKTRPRSHPAVKHALPRGKTAHPAATHAAPKPRTTAAPAKPAAPRTRQTVSRAPVVRQRPEPAQTKKRKK